MPGVRRNHTRKPTTKNPASNSQQAHTSNASVENLAEPVSLSDSLPKIDNKPVSDLQKAFNSNANVKELFSLVINACTSLSNQLESKLLHKPSMEMLI